MKTLAIAIALLLPTLLWAGEAKLTLYLLDHTGKSDSKTAFEAIRKQDKQPPFWIDWSKSWRGVTTMKSISGSDADTLISVLREHLLNTEAMHFCGHDPIYGVDAVTADGKPLKTSLCFKCGTWVKPDMRLDIKGRAGINNPLCKELRKLIELPKEVLEAKP